MKMAYNAGDGEEMEMEIGTYVVVWMSIVCCICIGKLKQAICYYCCMYACELNASLKA